MILFFAFCGTYRILYGTSFMVKDGYDTFVQKLTEVHITCLKKSTHVPMHIYIYIYIYFKKKISKKERLA
jgi:hypothetical protein